MEPKMEQQKQDATESVATSQKSKEEFSILRVLKVVLLTFFWPIGLPYFLVILRDRYIIGSGKAVKEHPFLKSISEFWFFASSLLAFFASLFNDSGNPNFLFVLVQFFLILVIPVTPVLYILWRDSGKGKTAPLKFIKGVVFGVFIIVTTLFSYYFFHEYFVVLTLAVLLVVAFGIDFFNKKKL